MFPMGKGGNIYVYFGMKYGMFVFFTYMYNIIHLYLSTCGCMCGMKLTYFGSMYV